MVNVSKLTRLNPHLTMKKSSLSRREFLSSSTLVAAGFWFGIGNASAKQENLISKQVLANDRLNIGIIGTANRAQSNIAGVASQNIVAICDIDDNYLNAASQRFPEAKTYDDFRKLID